MSWLFSRALVEEYSGASSSGGEPSALLSLMPSPHPFLRSGKTTAFCTPSQFGLTCALLTAERGADVLTSYLAASPARTSALPAAGTDLTASDPAFGWRWPGSFGRYDRDTRSWRTRQLSLLGGWELFSETWPRWGSMRGGESLARPTPVLNTCGNGSGYWPTPLVRGFTDEGSLTMLAKKCPTFEEFSAMAYRAAKSKKEKLYPTPVADDTAHRKSKYKQGGTALSTAVGGRLNPTWLEWLMGWPTDWTALGQLVTGKFHEWSQQHGGY